MYAAAQSPSPGAAEMVVARASHREAEDGSFIFATRRTGGREERKLQEGRKREERQNERRLILLEGV